ncbi:hypothetical protein Fmac_011810 [Flemingia macrophylla]|uniref:Uncharacterized protein n=1 Tax=Flemingia macrophylla TaxID=520843 RepID=A0ABD1MNG9_9FABA
MSSRVSVTKVRAFPSPHRLTSLLCANSSSSSNPLKECEFSCCLVLIAPSMPRRLMI